MFIMLFLLEACILFLTSTRIESRSLENIADSMIPSNSFYDLLGDHDIRHQYIDESSGPASRNNVDYLDSIDDWPHKSISSHFKQASGIHADNHGKVHLLHRGPNVWDTSSFDFNNNYLQAHKGPIPNDTVLVLDANTGELLNSWGKNKFYMPHGITLDKDGNSWITDVALHMVMKFPPGKDEASLILGEAFIPGSDTKHFCKPTDVAIASTGEFFVSDGYCNARILKFSPDGELMQIIGLHDSLLVPHSLSLDEKLDQLCVADRENFRVVCYSAGLKGNARVGQQLFTIQPPHMGRVYSIKHAGNQLIAVTGEGADQVVPAEATLVLDIPQQQLVQTWRPPRGFRMPHDVSISPDNSSVFIVDGDVDAPKKIYKVKFNKK